MIVPLHYRPCPVMPDGTGASQPLNLFQSRDAGAIPAPGLVEPPHMHQEICHDGTGQLAGKPYEEIINKY